MTATSGLVSWFGGPNDPGAQGTPASGIPIGTPGIAVYNRATLGGWWAIRAPNGSIGVLQQTDIGPAPSTGRRFDFTYSSLPLFGYSQQTFPTGASAQGVYLGHDISTASTHLSAALAQLGATPKQFQGAAVQVDTGAWSGTQAPFVIAPGGQPASTANTTPHGDVVSDNPLNQLPGAKQISDIGSAIGAIAGFLTNPTNWLRIGEVVLGAALILMGLRSLTGSTTTPVSVAKTAMKVAR
jgi:hypothetical protein